MAARPFRHNLFHPFSQKRLCLETLFAVECRKFNHTCSRTFIRTCHDDCMCVAFDLASQIQLLSAFCHPYHVVRGASAGNLDKTTSHANFSHNVADYPRGRLPLRAGPVRSIWDTSRHAERLHDLRHLQRALGGPNGLLRVHLHRLHLLHPALPDLPSMPSTAPDATCRHQAPASDPGLRAEDAGREIQMQHPRAW